jgi:ATP-binding cassette subfamily B protein
LPVDRKGIRVKIPLRQYWTLLVRYLGPQWPSVALLAVLLFGTISLQLLNPQIARQFIDAAQSGAPPAALVRVALLFLGVAMLQQTASVSAAYLGENVGWRATNELRANLAEHCLRLDMSFHNAHTPGEMIERVDGDVNALSNFLSLLALQLLGNGLLLAGVLVLLYREDWRIGVAFTLFAAAALAARWRVSTIAAPHWRAARAASADQFGFIQERLAGTEDIRSSGAQGYVMRRFYALMRDLMAKYFKVRLMVNIAVNTSHLLFAVANATAFALGAYLYQAGSITIGTVFMLSWYGNALMGPIRGINAQVEDLQQAAAGISRVQELFAIQTQIADVAAVSPDARPQAAFPQTASPQTALAVAFQHVTFGYAGQRARDAPERDDVEGRQDAVLRDLSFHLQPGTILGLLGRTGSGKTTLTRLLFRLYDPDQGTVCLGSDDALTDIRQLPLGTLRQHVAMVTQDIQLFHASVRDNLTFFDRTIPDEAIVRVIRDLGLGEWFDALPAGLDTELASGGGGLSAGEAQLLAFTRIFTQDPGLVVLDEASSRLDPVTEQLIERAVDRLIQGRTAIVIAHRLATVQRADQIMILEGGRIREYGPRAALAGDPDSHYYGLLRTGLEEVLA